MKSICTANKRDGSSCTLPSYGSNDLCWAHSPETAERRRRGQSRGGKGKANKVVKDLHALLEDLTQRVIDGELETSRGAVANQLISTRARLLEYERRLKEQEEILERIEALEAQRGVARRWGG